MSDSAMLSVRIDKSLKERLSRLAAAKNRSQSFLAAKAIEEFVDVQEWQTAGIFTALDTLDRGKSISHDKAKAWAESLRADNEKPVPQSE